MNREIKPRALALVGALFLIVVALLFFVFRSPFMSKTATQSAAESHASLKHLGVIMDGNRRWAKKRGLAPWLGHKQGVEPMRMTIEFCLKHKIPYLSLYVLSLENLKRSSQELDYLFNILALEIESEHMDEIYKRGVKVRFVGDRSRFPEQLIPVIKRVEEKTKDGKNLTLNLLFCYGGRQEIVAAVRDIARAVKSGKLSPDDIDGDRFEEFLWLGKIPQPDLIIRTGKDYRLSNFLTYQLAYSELYFLDCYWPEVTEKHLEDILENFAKRKRTFGA